jgi:starvation-inducible outer membrane lipoprotein
MTNKKMVLGMLGVLLVFGLVLMGCGADPKGLAKQSYEIVQQMQGAVSDPSKLAALAKKAAAIEKKAEKLSDNAKAVYASELARLTAGALGEMFK